jgi:hypothetical protein
MSKIFKGLLGKAPRQVAPPTVLSRTPDQQQAKAKDPNPEQDVAVTDRERRRRLEEAQQRGGTASTVLSEGETLG